ncbi:ribosome recycling factor [Veillonella sp. YH-vei2232]|jgi:ribosome recycling factor|uniref:Ribosome-recycling factor n=1 Tax=Veillonella absiana TaxID=3079305 RepID=A0ABU3Z976_9FIRM|nr:MULTISPECIES: ribosome recycling factor [unclassified Veillonella]NCB95649.1 ribosome recycling factor [Negativicutes bacterium]MBP6922567.1 ribosome recycling factor [Veillonella sp.]MBP8616547.1 ribosome recycling factor [Veillonella sp.]MBP9550479.1 ribosome recycling factor [Veillonella sp.]MDV5062851.1 ribosome recycling factor [Veillonella sp. YH-vei2232]
MEVKELLAQEETRMDKSIEALKHEFASIRTGRASVSLLDKVMVDYYGTPSPINQVANISVPEPRMILIAPWDKSMIGAIEKAILQSDLGLNPGNDGAQIRLVIPQLTEERRKEIVKVVHKKAEDAKVAIRNIRRDANDAIKKEEKAKTITEDDAKDGLDQIQKLTDAKIKQIDQLKDVKEKDVLEV